MQDAPYEVAIVGGGIVGVNLAAGLIRRNIKVKLFEQARNFTEIGVGIGFTANTVRCMQEINPDIITSLHDGGAVPKDAFRYLDGFFQVDPNNPDVQEFLGHLDAGEKGWEFIRRDLFLIELVKKLPQDAFRLSSRLSNVKQEGPDGQVVLSFTDGFTYRADALIACDGLKSKTRQILLGPDDPASYPQYTNKVGYRTLLPIEKVREAIGDYKTEHLHFHIGPGAHLLHYPVNSKMVGSAVYIHDPNEWPLNAPFTAQGVRTDVLAAVEGWAEPVRKLVELFPEKLEKWALFDMYEYPLKQYNFDRITLAGDAAHASSPHHGAGASFGIEDALCLCTVLDEVSAAVTKKAVDKTRALRLAFETYDEIRRCRTQWLVNSSRRTCDLYQQPEWGDAVRRVKAQTCFEEVKDRSFKIWHFNSAQMVSDTIANYARRLLSSSDSLAHATEAPPEERPTIVRHDTPTEELDIVQGNIAVSKPVDRGTNATRQEEAVNSAAVAKNIHWLVQIPDHQGMLGTRVANIAGHMSNTGRRLTEGKLAMAGPSLSLAEVEAHNDQPSMTGSVQIITASSAGEVLELLREDPFAKLGVWNLDQATLQPIRVGVVGPMLKA